MKFFKHNASLEKRSREQTKAVELITKATGPLAIEAVRLIRTLPAEEADIFGRKFIANVAIQAVIGQDFYWDASTCVSRAQEFATTSVQLNFLGGLHNGISVEYNGEGLRRETIEAALPSHSQSELFPSES